MISVLMPVYNGIEFIEESVSSVINQEYKEWELLIGINGHPENSEIYKIAKSFEEKNVNIRVFDFYTIKGKVNTLNEMVKYCKYEHIALLDVDDIWHTKKLAIQTKYLQKYDVVGSRCIYFGDINGIIPKIPLGDISKENFFLVNPIINSSSIIRKKDAQWRNFDGVEDYDMWLRLRKQNLKFYNCSEVLVKHRIHTESAFNANGNHMLVSDLLKLHRNNEL